MVKPLTISEKLYLVIPIYGDDGETITAYVHSAPISRETFEAHYMLMAQTFAAIRMESLGVIAGPRVASLLMQDIARRKGDEMNALALMNEIRRMSNVMLRETTGWSPMPFQEVADRKLISEDDLSKVINAIVFFIVTSAMLERREAKDILPGAAKLWGAQISSSDFTVFAGSLTTSKEHGHIPKIPASSAVY